MRVYPVLACWVLTMLAGTLPASAQDAAFGVTIGYPGSVGVQWQPVSRLAVRPAITFRNSGSDVDEDAGSIESSSLSTSISGLVYLRPAGPAPRLPVATLLIHPDTFDNLHRSTADSVSARHHHHDDDHDEADYH